MRSHQSGCGLEACAHRWGLALRDTSNQQQPCMNNWSLDSLSAWGGKEKNDGWQLDQMNGWHSFRKHIHCLLHAPVCEYIWLTHEQTFKYIIFTQASVFSHGCLHLGLGRTGCKWVYDKTAIASPRNAHTGGKIQEDFFTYLTISLYDWFFFHFLHIVYSPFLSWYLPKKSYKIYVCLYEYGYIVACI